MYNQLIHMVIFLPDVHKAFNSEDHTEYGQREVIERHQYPGHSGYTSDILRAAGGSVTELSLSQGRECQVVLTEEDSCVQD